MQHLNEFFNEVSKHGRVYLPPECPTCGAKLLRWSWWENTHEPIVYWYCLECDKRGIEPCLHAMQRNDMVLLRRLRCAGKYHYICVCLYDTELRQFAHYTTLRSYLKGKNKVGVQ